MNNMKWFLVIFSFLLVLVILDCVIAKETEAWRVGTSSKKLEMLENTDSGTNGENIRNITTTIDEDELNVLEDGSIRTEKGTAGYNQYINFDNKIESSIKGSGFVKFLENDNDITSDFLYFRSGEQIAKYSLEFKTSLQSDVEDENRDKDPTGTYLGDFEGNKIKILGKEYDIMKARRVTSAGSSVELTLIGDSIEDLLEEKGTKTYHFNGKDYLIEAVIITNSAPITVKFRVNGDLLKSLGKGQTFTLLDGTVIGVSEILLNDGDNESDYVKFLLGTSMIYLRDTNIQDRYSSNVLYHGGECIDDTHVIITGRDDNETFSIDTIELNITSDDDYFVAAGHSLTEYMDEPQAFLGSWDIKYMGLSDIETEIYKIKTNGPNQYELEFINKEGNLTTIPILYATGDSNIQFAHEDNILILNTSAGMKIELLNETESNYILATFSTPNELDYDNVVPTPVKLKLGASNSKVYFEEADGSTIDWVSPSEEPNIKYAYTSRGAKFKWDDPPGDPDLLTIEYPKKQRLPLVYIIGYQPIIDFSTIDSTIQTFFSNSDSFYIVVGSKASAEDVIAATNIAVSFRYHAMQNCPATTTCKLNPTKLDSEIDDLYNTNVVSIGRPQYNSITNLFLPSSLWPLEKNTALISRFVHGDTATLVIAGNNDWGTRQASKVIANFDDYNLNDTCFEVDTEDSDDLILSECDFSKYPVKENCTIPTDGMVITENTTFCPGTYPLPNGIEIGADNVVLDCGGAVLNGTRDTIRNIGGIYLSSREDVTIKNCVVKNYNRGMYLYNSKYNKILSSMLYSNVDEGVRLYNEINPNNSHNLIDRCVFFNNSGPAIVLYWSDFNYILNNVIQDNFNGIWIDQSPNSIIDSNNFTNNGGALIIKNGSVNTSILKNNFYNNAVAIGQEQGAGYSNYEMNNIIDNYHHGIVFDFDTNPIHNFVNNNIFNNYFDLQLNGPMNITVEYNYWGSINATIINASIRHFYHTTPPGIVDFCPFLNAPWPDGEAVECEGYQQPIPVGEFSDHGIDTDGDGFYDYLVIEFNLTVNKSGEYEIWGILEDSSGNILYPVGNKEFDFYLNTGENRIQLNFSGIKIYMNSVDGPYKLIRLDIEGDDFDLNYYTMYNTSFYNYTDFQKPGASFTGIFLDYGYDEDGDGLHDYLIVEAEINVTRAGNYRISGELEFDEIDIELDPYTNIYLEVGINKIQLNFSGVGIFRSGVDGPYHPIEMRLYDLDDYVKLDEYDYTSSAYNYTDFQRPYAKFTGFFSDYGYDEDGDGLYDYLTIEVGINTTKKGIYRIRYAVEYPDSDTEDYSEDFYLLEGFNIVHLNLSGISIYNMGLDGVYRLDMLRLYDWNHIKLEQLQNAYTTASYNYTHFQRPGLEVTGNFTDYGVDTDTDGLYDYLTIMVPVNVAVPGYYQIEAEMDDINADIDTAIYFNSSDKFIYLNFPGFIIYKNGRNGSYVLEDFWIEYDDFEIYEMEDEYYTNPYNYTDFEHEEENLPPEIEEVSEVSETIRLGDIVHFEVSALDPNNDDLIFNWYVDGEEAKSYPPEEEPAEEVVEEEEETTIEELEEEQVTEAEPTIEEPASGGGGGGGGVAKKPKTVINQFNYYANETGEHEIKVVISDGEFEIFHTWDVNVKDAIENEMKAEVEKLLDSALFSPIDNANMCIIIKEDYDYIHHSFDIVITNGVKQVSVSEERYCDGFENEDFVFSFIDYQSFLEQKQDLTINSLIENCDGSRFYILPSKFVEKGGNIITNEEFKEKYCPFVRDNFNGASMILYGLSCCISPPTANTFDGNTTDFSSLNTTELANLSNVILEKTTYGKIDFGSSILDLTGNLNLDSYVAITNGIVAIDTNNLPTLNKSATITMYGLTYQTTPIIYYNQGFTTNPSDFTIPCPTDICSNINYNPSTGILKFDVTHFSSYYGTLEEKPPTPPPVVTTTNLTISDLDVKIGDKTDKDLSNGDKIGKEAKPNDKVNFDIEIENAFSKSSDIEIEDIEVTVTIKDIDDGDDLEESVDIDNLDAGDDDSVSLEFTIPTLVDEEEYDVIIEVDGKDEKGSDHELRWELKLEVKKDKHALLIEKADLSPLTISCNRNPSLDLKVINIGREDEDEVRITISNGELGLNIEENNIELEEGSDEDSVFEKTYNLKIDDEIEERIYPISVKAYYDNKFSDQKIVDLSVEKCVEKAITPVEIEPTEVIVETPKITKPIEPPITQISFTETPGFIAVLLFIFIILLGLVIFAFGYIILRK